MAVWAIDEINLVPESPGKPLHTRLSPGTRHTVTPLACAARNLHVAIALMVVIQWGASLLRFVLPVQELIRCAH